jgi:Organic solute transporter Ostalpha
MPSMHSKTCLDSSVSRLLMCFSRVEAKASCVARHPLQGVLSYVILRPLMTLVATLAMLLGTYNDGSLSYDSLYTYVSIINATSQMWALYCLVLMYQVRYRVPTAII